MGIIVELDKMRNRSKKNLKRLGMYYVYLLLVWGSFRYWVRLPEVIEELWFKPVIWLLPLFWWRMSFKKDVKFSSDRWLLSGGLGLLVGLFYFGLIRVFNIGGGVDWSLDLFGVLLATSIVEELTFSGLVLGILDLTRGKKIINLVLIGLMVMGVHLPINVFVNGLAGKELLGVMIWLFSMAIINGWVRQKTGNVLGSVIARLGLMLSIIS